MARYCGVANFDNIYYEILDSLVRLEDNLNNYNFYIDEINDRLVYLNTELKFNVPIEELTLEIIKKELKSISENGIEGEYINYHTQEEIKIIDVYNGLLEYIYFENKDKLVKEDKFRKLIEEVEKRLEEDRIEEERRIEETENSKLKNRIKRCITNFKNTIINKF